MKMLQVIKVRKTVILLVMLLTHAPSFVVATFSGPASGVALTVTRVEAIVGGEAELPCNTRTEAEGDRVLLIVLYREDEPVYSYDTREVGESARWVDDLYAGRLEWRDQPRPAFRLQPLVPEDRASFMCRIDFLITQTRNYKIALNVIELPKKPEILDEHGKELSGTAGPFRQDSEFRLICSVAGGYPVPRIQWLLGDVVISSLSASEYAPPVRSLPLVILNATRAYFGLTYTCKAENTLLAPAPRTSVKVDLYLKPFVVEIMERELPLSTDMKASLRCRSSGSRPPANVTWWLDGRPMDGAVRQLVNEEDKHTESVVEWTPKKAQNGKRLTCRAENDYFRNFAIEAKKTLDVYYGPEVSIHLGASVNANDIEEGDDVYFECRVDANPPPYKVIWQHNGVVVQHNVAQGVIVTGYVHLALRNVSRHQAGLYTCAASNVEGDGTATGLHMQVVYRPLCKTDKRKIIGSPLQEPATVVCEVQAQPAPHSFEWTLNNSAGHIKVDPERYTIEEMEGKSILTFTPMSDIDYGTLACRARNMVGQQVVPCLYVLLPATRPDAPTNCTVYNLTDHSLDLICQPGYEGGLQCIYMVEVWAARGLVVNASSAGGHWHLRRLLSNQRLKLLVYAANAQGRSQLVALTVETPGKWTSSTAGGDYAMESWESKLAVSVLAVAVGVFLVCVAVFFVCKFLRETRYEVTLPAMKNQKVVVQNRCSPQSFDDKNPDLIPLNKGGAECAEGAEGAGGAGGAGGPPDPPSYSALRRSGSALGVQRAHDYYTGVQFEGAHHAAASTRPRREIVTTKTRLMSAEQESCV